MRNSTTVADPRWRWKIIAPFLAVSLSISSWCGLFVGSATFQFFSCKPSGHSFVNFDGFLTAPIVSGSSVAMFSLTGISTLLTWQHMTRKRRRGESISTPLSFVITGIGLAVTIFSTVVVSVTKELYTAFGLMYYFVSAVIFLMAGSLVGVCISLIPHAPGYLSDFHTEYIMMATVPAAGLITAMVPSMIFLSVPGIIVILIIVIFFAVLHYVLNDMILGVRQSFIQEITSLLLVRQGQCSAPVPQDYLNEPRPLTAAWKTLRRARPFAPMMSLILAANMAASHLSHSLSHDIHVSLNASMSQHFHSYGNVNVTLLLLCLPACLVPLAIHFAYYRQREAVILQPILAIIVAIGPALAHHWLGPCFLHFKDHEVAWWFLMAFVVSSIARAALVAAAYVDMLYQVFLANEEMNRQGGALSIPAGTGALAIMSGSIGVMAGALNTLHTPVKSCHLSSVHTAVTSAFPAALMISIIAAIIWREYRPIAIEE